MRMNRFALSAVLFSVLSPTFALGGVTYSYDAQLRLAQALYTDGTSITYSYDATGNRTAAVVAGPSSTAQGGAEQGSPSSPADGAEAAAASAEN